MDTSAYDVWMPAGFSPPVASPTALIPRPEQDPADRHEQRPEQDREEGVCPSRCPGTRIMRAAPQDNSGSVREEIPDARAQEGPAEGDHRQRTKQAVPDGHVAMPANDSANDEQHDRRRGRKIDHRDESGPPRMAKPGIGVAGLAVVVANGVVMAVHQI